MLSCRGDTGDRNKCHLHLSMVPAFYPGLYSARFRAGKAEVFTLGLKQGEVLGAACVGRLAGCSAGGGGPPAMLALGAVYQCGLASAILGIGPRWLRERAYGCPRRTEARAEGLTAFKEGIDPGSPHPGSRGSVGSCLCTAPSLWPTWQANPFLLLHLHPSHNVKSSHNSVTSEGNISS